MINRSLFNLGLFSHLKYVVHFHVRQFHVWTFKWSAIFMSVIFSALVYCSVQDEL